MRVIDCRCRPTTPEYQATLENIGFQTVFRKTGNSIPTQTTTLAEFVTEFEKAGITQIVCMGRDMARSGVSRVTNETVAAMVREQPGKIIGLAGIDPLRGADALTSIDHAINTLKLTGVSMDTGLMDICANDARLYPIYQKCSDLNVPVFLTIGPMPKGSGKLRFANPLDIDDVAADFPSLRILCSHGGFPWTQEMIAIAWRHEHVYFETSLYWTKPGVHLIVDAANSIIGDKLCFASCFPFEPMKQSLDTFMQLGFKEEILPNLLAGNAAKLLGV